MPSKLSREDGGVAFVSSPRAAGVAAHFQKLSLDVVDVGGSGGCVWVLGRLGLQCCGIGLGDKTASSPTVHGIMERSGVRSCSSLELANR
jgi:hypothetical protein